MNKRLIIITAGCIIVMALVLTFLSSLGDSVIVDEVPHIGAAYSYVTHHDMRLNPEHPPLVKDLAGIPLLFLHLHQDAFQTKDWTTEANGQWEFGRKLIYNSGNNADQIKFWARLPVFAFFILAALMIFYWSRRLYGDGVALLALVVFCFSPTVLAHAHYVTTDMAALAGVLCAIYFFCRYLHAPTPGRMMIAGGVLALALLTKFSTILLIPYFLIIFLVWQYWYGDKIGIRHILGIFVISICIVWPVYYLNNYNYPAVTQHRNTVEDLKYFRNRSLAKPILWASDKPVIRYIDHYLLGIAMQLQHDEGGHSAFFLGKISAKGTPWYFPVVYLIKEPLAWWGLVIIALITLLVGSWKISWYQKSFLKKHFEELMMVLWLVMYWGMSISSNINIGIRHLLPVYPFAIMLVAGQIGKLSHQLKQQKYQKILAVVVGALMGVYIHEAWAIYPFYLSYFNQIAGGPAGGYRYVVDSNLDWGQDLIRFSQWVKSNHINKIEFDYFGWADQQYYLGDRFIWLVSSRYKNAQDFLDHNHSDGWLAVSAQSLQTSDHTYDWLKVYRPAAVIGHSIFVYHLLR